MATVGGRKFRKSSAPYPPDKFSDPLLKIITDFQQ